MQSRFHASNRHDHREVTLDFVSIGKIVVITMLFMILDIITGYAGAWLHGTISSTVMRDGLGHKFAFIAFIAMAALIDFAQSENIINLGVTLQLTTLTCIYIVITEINSIAENIIIIFPELENTPIMNIFKNSANMIEKLADQKGDEINGKHMDRKP